MKIYISGPITGRDIDEAREHFARVQLRLMELGHEAVNPLDNGLDETHSWRQHMVKDIDMLMQCDAICLLYGWRESRGARIEHNIATELNLAIMDEGAIRVIKEAERQPANYRAEMTICTSIMRREGIKYKLFDYRGRRNLTSKQR